MEFKVKDKGQTGLEIARQIGYFLQNPIADNDEYSLVREIRQGYRYPRFHIYLKRDRENNWLVINFHLDEDSHSHEGKRLRDNLGSHEDDSFEKEAGRVKNILENS
jgi:hypothetical protein